MNENMFWKWYFLALRRLRASGSVEEDIEEMRAEERAQQAESHISTMELICSPTLRPPLIIGIVMQLSQQFSGINAVFYYSTSLFMSSGLTEESAKFATIGIGAIMVRQKQIDEEYRYKSFKVRIGMEIGQDMTFAVGHKEALYIFIDIKRVSIPQKI